MPFFTEQFRNGLYDELYPPSNLPIPRKIWQVRFAAGTLEVPLMSIEEALKLEAQKKKIAEESMGLGIEAGRKAAVESLKNAEVAAQKETFKQAETNAKEAMKDTEKQIDAVPESAKHGAKQAETAAVKDKDLAMDNDKVASKVDTPNENSKELSIGSEALPANNEKKEPSTWEIKSGKKFHGQDQLGKTKPDDAHAKPVHKVAHGKETSIDPPHLPQSEVVGDSRPVAKGGLGHKKEDLKTPGGKLPQGKEKIKGLVPSANDSPKEKLLSNEGSQDLPRAKAKPSLQDPPKDQTTTGKSPVLDETKLSPAEKNAALKEESAKPKPKGVEHGHASIDSNEEPIRKSPKPIEMDGKGESNAEKPGVAKEQLKEPANRTTGKDSTKDAAQNAAKVATHDTAKDQAVPPVKDSSKAPDMELMKDSASPPSKPHGSINVPAQKAPTAAAVAAAAPAAPVNVSAKSKARGKSKSKYKRSNLQIPPPTPPDHSSPFPPPPPPPPFRPSPPTNINAPHPPLPSLLASHSLHSLTAHNPDFSHTLLTTQGASSFASYHLSHTHPSLLPIYLSLRAPTLKAEITRYIVLAAAGGYWADLDTISLRSFEDLVPIEQRTRVHCIVGVEYDQGEDLTLWPGIQRRVQFARWTLAAAPGHILPSRMAVRALEGVERLAKERGKGVWECEFSEEEVEGLVGAGRWADEVFRVLGEGIGGEVRAEEVSGLREARVWGDVLVLPWEVLGGWQVWGKGRGRGEVGRGVVRRFGEGAKF
ncbi:MAG: hypothetical protein MMC23_004811 [Stictis urceolatum]|nr:hypothetical protein [Stictis urceolata]